MATKTTKPKPIQVGVITCPMHDDDGPKPQARVKKSLVTNKLFIDCQCCGLIMPTLQHPQEYIKKHATFNDDFKNVYGEPGAGYGAGRKEPDGAGVDTPKRETEQAEVEKEEAAAAKAEPQSEPEQVKSGDWDGW